MRKLVYLLGFLGGVLLFTSCYNKEDEPRFTERTLVFSSEGGSQHVKIEVRRYAWRFVGLLLPEVNSDNRAVTVYEYDKRIQRVLLPDGREEIRYEWARFIISQDRRSIEVILAPNDTGKVRRLGFQITGKKEPSDFRVRQDP